MIDIHAHILPAVDDGAKDDTESQLMLQDAICEGIHTIVATPHYQPRFLNEKATILKKVELLQQMAVQKQLDINILPGQEIRIYGQLLEDFEAGKLLSLADSNYILIEFPFHDIPHYTERLFYDIGLQGLIPIIAHPERNTAFLKNPEKLYNLVTKGALAQLTSSSIAGFFGKEVQKFSEQLIEANLVHMVASDAHNTTNRKFNLSEAYEQIMKKYGASYVSYFEKNAHAVVADEPVICERPLLVEKRKFLGFF